MLLVFIAMNRFQVVKGKETEFEQVWKGRDSRLSEMTGFEEFKLLRGPEHDEHTLYSSFTIWRSKENFEAWTKSEQFRDAHRNAGQNDKLYLGHPNFEGFEPVNDIA